MKRFFLFIFFSVGVMELSFSQEKTDGTLIRGIDSEVVRLMNKGNIPGASIVIINGDQQIIRNYGYSDVKDRKPVTSNTLFQIGSCSKAFTAMAVVSLEQEGKLSFSDTVTRYLPWLTVTYKKKKVEITILQLLHHTSGIPWTTISNIPASDAPDALEKTIRPLEGQKLDHLPGEEYEYATINYDILALIVQKITGEPFEEYVNKNIIGKLDLIHTRMGSATDSSLMSKGYKIGFFRPLEYQAPVFRGNNAAGYVITNAGDIAKWLKFQMGLIPADIYGLAAITHERDETVPLHDMSAYAMGWNISLNGNGETYHAGSNPNFTSFLTFRPSTKTGVAILANSNSGYTTIIAENIMKLLAGEKLTSEYDPGDNNDRAYSLITFILGLYVLMVTALLIFILVTIIRKKRNFDGIYVAKFKKVGLSLLFLSPFLLGLYLFPAAYAGFSWESIAIWTPVSFMTMISLILTAIVVSYLTWFVGIFFPEKNKFKRNGPRILLLSVLSGLANMVIIAIITSALYSGIELKYLIFYYLLTLSLYLAGRKIVQTSLTRLNTELIFDLRVELTEKILSTSYQRFERIDRGRIYTALNDDVSTLADSTNMIVSLFTSFFTATAAFLYLASIALWATFLTLSLIICIALLYYYVSRSTKKYFERARDTQNTFMRLINGMIDGFKEISLHVRKKLEYKRDMETTADEIRDKIATANIRFINAFLVGESMVIVLLGSVVLAMPKLFPDIPLHTIMGFVIILLYLIGPVTGILNSLPSIMRIRIAWRRIQQFLRDIPANMDLYKIAEPLDDAVETFAVEDLIFHYDQDKEQRSFKVGPINFRAGRGEIVFIIGGNGSGKTTLAKLLTGLYQPDSGKIMINNKVLHSAQQSEYFSVIFNPVYLFDKLYGISTKHRPEEIGKHLHRFDLGNKLRIRDDKYSTIKLSGGQRKRMALLECYLENSPIFLFDEWAADQDPEFRDFFYMTLLPEMKAMGKIVIAITHDKHYFYVADKVLTMQDGKLESCVINPVIHEFGG